MGFNPTLVRLRPGCPPQAMGQAPPCFNPTLVRLRRVDREELATRWGLFQSHAGSIEAQGGGFKVWANLYVSIPRWFD